MISGIALLTYALTSQATPSYVQSIQEVEALAQLAQNRDSKADTTFGLPDREFNRLIFLIGSKMVSSDLDYKPGMSVSELGDSIKFAVSSELQANKIAIESPIGQRLLAQGICDWVRTHVVYNDALEPQSISSSQWKYEVPQEVRIRYWTSKTLLEAPKLFAVCAGFTRLTHDLARQVGLQAYLVNGFTRFPKNQFAGRRNHGWNVFAFKLNNGSVIFIPSDNTRGRVELSRARKDLSRLLNPFVLPSNEADWGVFLWKQQASELDGGGVLSPEGLQLSSLSLDKWKKLGSPKLMESIESRVLAENKPATTTEVPR